MKILNVHVNGFINALMGHLGPTLVVICPILILALAFIFFSLILPYQFPLPHQHGGLEPSEPTLQTFLRALHILWSCYVLVCIGFHFSMSVSTDPNGRPSQRNSAFFEFLDDEETEMTNGDESVMCQKCQAVKFERMHHCSVCNRCILRMDHHVGPFCLQSIDSPSLTKRNKCPWINNCVGHYNHRYFVLFVGYTTVALFYFALMSISLFWKAFIQKQNMRWPFYRARGLFLFGFLVSVLVGGALFALLGWHVYLISTGQTTIEFYRNQVSIALARMDGQIYTNEYNKGVKRNAETFFSITKSPYRWWSILLPLPVPPVGNGKVWD